VSNFQYALVVKCKSVLKQIYVEEIMLCYHGFIRDWADGMVTWFFTGHQSKGSTVQKDNYI
jgi:hypothetical protein